MIKLITVDQLLEVVQKVSGLDMEVKLDTPFETLEMDSTNIVEVLIELEMVLDIDILDANLNLYELIKVSDVYAYLQNLTT